MMRRLDQFHLAMGFTLLEMLLSLALAVLLMGVLLSVIGSVRRSRAALLPDSVPAHDHHALLQLLRDDVFHAQNVTTTEREVQLTGLCALHRQTFQPTHLPARVRYRVAYIGARSCLVREQVVLDELSNQATSTELAAMDVVSFSLRVTQDPDSQRTVAALLLTWDRPEQPPLTARWLVE